MEIRKLLTGKKLEVSPEPPYDAFQAFVRANHIALKGLDRGRLRGLTFAAKDVFKILGSTYGNGHPDWLRTNPPDDFTSGTITKLLEEGADLVGKTVCDELCFSISGENWNYGSPLNPLDLTRFAGGSSSGSAVAVSSGLADFAIGSDCLGSVRVPASYTGVLGMRPSYARVPNDGEAPYCKSMDVLGYMSACPETFHRVSEVLLGEDQTPIKYRRLLVAQDFFDLVDESLQEPVRLALDHLKAGFEKADSERLFEDRIDDWVKTFRTVQGYEVWESYGSWINKYRPPLSRGPKERLAWASTLTLQEYRNALEEREEIIRSIHEIVSNDTILCIPTTCSMPPFKNDTAERINDIRMKSSKFLAISPLSNTPHLTLPLVWDEGVSLGISLIGAAGSDMSLIDTMLPIFKDFQTKHLS